MRNDTKSMNYHEREIVELATKLMAAGGVVHWEEIRKAAKAGVAERKRMNAETDRAGELLRKMRRGEGPRIMFTYRSEARTWIYIGHYIYFPREKAWVHDAAVHGVSAQFENMHVRKEQIERLPLPQAQAAGQYFMDRVTFCPFCLCVRVQDVVEQEWLRRWRHLPDLGSWGSVRRGGEDLAEELKKQLAGNPEWVVGACADRWCRMTFQPGQTRRAHQRNERLRRTEPKKSELRFFQMAAGTADIANLCKK
jgi:hypothetical protein